jgi:hypothetical protein
MFCPKCGAQVPDGSPFCSSCGAPMAQQQAPTNQGMNFNQPKASGGSNDQFDFNPANMFNDFLAFFKKPSATIQQIIGWAGALLLLISTFLPNYKYSISSYFKVSVSGNLWETRHAIYTILLLLFVILAIFFIFIKKHIGVIAAGGLIFLWWIIDIASKTSLYSTGIGLWLFFISSLAILGAGIWGFIDSRK